MNALDDLVNTDRCTLYEDSASFSKDKRFTKTEYQTPTDLGKPLKDERQGLKNHHMR